jgi:hypothetical protein
MFDNKMIFGNPLNEQNVKNTNKQFKDIEESLLAQYHMLHAQSSKLNHYCSPKRRRELKILAPKILELWKAIAEYAIEYEFIDLQMLLDDGA